MPYPQGSGGLLMLNLIPMAGRGNRFFQERYRVPKPFIPVMGKPMLVTSVKSFPPADRYIFLGLNEHVQKYNLSSIVEQEFKEARVISVKEVTPGPACTCLLAESYLNPEEGLLIASCDYQTVYDQNRYAALVQDESIDVIIWTFRMGTIKKANPRAFAYCVTRGEEVVEVVEKRTISAAPEKDPCVAGSFTYRRSSDFIRGAKKMIERDLRVNNEFYVATSINQLIEEGKKVVTFEVDYFISFGNPFELELVQYWQEFFDQLEDHPYTLDCRYKAPAL